MLVASPLQVKAYQHLREMIEKEELVDNVIYSETKMAVTLGVSRTPMRDALQRLEQEGFIEILPSRGFQLQAITPERIHKNNQVRSAPRAIRASYSPVWASFCSGRRPSVRIAAPWRSLFAGIPSSILPLWSPWKTRSCQRSSPATCTASRNWHESPSCTPGAWRRPFGSTGKSMMPFVWAMSRIFTASPCAICRPPLPSTWLNWPKVRPLPPRPEPGNPQVTSADWIFKRCPLFRRRNSGRSRKQTNALMNRPEKLEG